MKRRMTVIVMVVACTAAVWAEDPVYFADPNFKMTVEEKLGVIDPTPSDMLNLTVLEVSRPRIFSLTGLEYATNLQELGLVD